MSLTPEQIAAAQAQADAVAAEVERNKQMLADLERMRQLQKESQNNPHQ